MLLSPLAVISIKEHKQGSSNIIYPTNMKSAKPAKRIFSKPSELSEMSPNKTKGKHPNRPPPCLLFRKRGQWIKQINKTYAG